MKLSPSILRAAYAMLDECEPFRRWNLPEAEDVDIKIEAKTNGKFTPGKSLKDFNAKSAKAAAKKK